MQSCIPSDCSMLKYSNMMNNLILQYSDFVVGTENSS